MFSDTMNLSFQVSPQILQSGSYPSCLWWKAGLHPPQVKGSSQNNEADTYYSESNQEGHGNSSCEIVLVACHYACRTTLLCSYSIFHAHVHDVLRPSSGVSNNCCIVVNHCFFVFQVFFVLYFNWMIVFTLHLTVWTKGRAATAVGSN